LSDTRVYEPYIRALLGTASQFYEVVVLIPRTVPNAGGALGPHDSGSLVPDHLQLRRQHRHGRGTFLLLFSSLSLTSLELSDTKSLEYEASLEPLHISAKVRSFCL
jgi:hypothetical protein